jgi:hypothetical protein
VPPVTPETWQALLAAADAFGTLAPWSWMHDSELLGLRHPATGEEFLCSILGRLRQVFALLVFRRETGRRWILETVLNADDSDRPEDPDSGMEQDCVKVGFEPKGELTKEDRAVLTAAGFTPTMKRGCVWPAFRSLVPGGYPWYLTQAEAELLLWALPRVGAFAALCRDTPGVGEEHQAGEAPFLPLDFDPAQRALRAEDLDWHPLIAPPEPPPDVASLDEATVARLLKLEQAKGFHLELDVFYSPVVIAGEERPYFPKVAMAVDHASGFVGGFHMAESGDLQGAASLAQVLSGALLQLGSRPETLRVQRPRVGQMLATVANHLGIPIYGDPELSALNSARVTMERRFMR